MKLLLVRHTSASLSMTDHEAPPQSHHLLNLNLNLNLDLNLNSP